MLVRFNPTTIGVSWNKFTLVELKGLANYIQSARRGHVFHTLSYLYRKYVVYFGCQAHAPRAIAYA